MWGLFCCHRILRGSLNDRRRKLVFESGIKYLNINGVLSARKEFPMEILKLLWILIFFLFSLNLIFIWSKIYVIYKRLDSLSAVLKKINDLEEEFHKPRKTEPKAL